MLPPAKHNLPVDDIEKITAVVKAPFLAALDEMQISTVTAQDLVDVYLPLAASLLHSKRRHATPVIGVNGAQGAGKSTLCRLLKLILEKGFQQRVALLSIDDLYLTREQRQGLAARIHPLFITRGVPGTHDVQLGLELIGALRQLGRGQAIALPVFDKAIDDRLGEDHWHEVTGPVDLVLFEGWCIGARPQADAALAKPVNELEQARDPDMTWRDYVNNQLKGAYRRLFAELDMLIMLKVPDLESVFTWRALQERQLAATRDPHSPQRIMSPEALTEFIMHYERLTRWMLDEMPERADLVLQLDREHRLSGLRDNTMARTHPAASCSKYSPAQDVQTGGPTGRDTARTGQRPEIDREI